MGRPPPNWNWRRGHGNGEWAVRGQAGSPFCSSFHFLPPGRLEVVTAGLRRNRQDPYLFSDNEQLEASSRWRSPFSCVRWRLRLCPQPSMETGCGIMVPGSAGTNLLFCPQVEHSPGMTGHVAVLLLHISRLTPPASGVPTAWARGVGKGIFLFFAPLLGNFGGQQSHSEGTYSSSQPVLLP